MLKGRIYLALPVRGNQRATPKIGSPQRSLGIRMKHITAGTAAILLLAGCDPTRRVAEGDVLLRKNRIEVDAKGVDGAELEAILKQKPNKRVLGVPFYLHVHNMPDPEKIPVWKAKKDRRIDRINEKRAEKGKPPKPYKRTRAEWLRETVGEAPVILDSALTGRSVSQLRQYMAREGWFRATVRDTVRSDDRNWYGARLHRPKGKVKYIIEAGAPYTIRNIRVTVDDTAIQALIQENWHASLLKTGNRFDDDDLDAERTRVTNALRDVGYLYFTRDLLQYVADTSVGGQQVDLDLRIERPLAREHRALTGTPEGTIFRLRDVYISTVPQTRGGAVSRVDTLSDAGNYFLYRDQLPYRPKSLLHPIFLRPGERYRQGNATNTYRRLTGLGVFDRVDVAYDTTGLSKSAQADVRITLLPGRSQSFSVEGFLTNRGGALGTSVNLGYRHRNLFRTLASITGGLTIGLEAQQSITSGSEGSTGGTRAGSLFNTVSIGPEVTFGFPAPFRKLFSKSSGSRLLVNALYSYQRRPDYTRSVSKISIGMQWNESRANTIGVFPLEVSSIKIPQTTPEFDQYLIDSNDPVLRDSYTDHLIAGMRGVHTHITPDGESRINSFFSRVTLEWAGHPMLVPMNWLAEETQDSTGNVFYTVAGVRYAEFVKADSDLRWRHTLHEKSSLAFRVAAGVGVPYGNLPVLPFESSFFVGGANGLRAWRARSIGPGSYSAPLDAFDRTGEIRLEGNAEYRFDLIGYLEGALFVDVGNIWNLQENESKPGGQFTRKFISEFAVGTGIGARLNFDFFIVRFDLGMQTKDPSLPPGERWLFQPKDEYEAQVSNLNGTAYQYKTQFNFNLGIGYPF